MHVDYQTASELSREVIGAAMEVHPIMGPQQKFAETAKQTTELHERMPFSEGNDSVPDHWMLNAER